MPIQRVASPFTVETGFSASVSVSRVVSRPSDSFVCLEPFRPLRHELHPSFPQSDSQVHSVRLTSITSPANQSPQQVRKFAPLAPPFLQYRVRRGIPSIIRALAAVRMYAERRVWKWVVGDEGQRGEEVGLGRQSVILEQDRSVSRPVSFSDMYSVSSSRPFPTEMITVLFMRVPLCPYNAIAPFASFLTTSLDLDISKCNGCAPSTFSDSGNLNVVIA